MSKRKKIKIGVIFGGKSGEHEVSIVSAESIMKNLSRKKYQVTPIGVTKNGKWLIRNPIKALKTGKSKEKGTQLIPENVLKRLDVVFPIIHGSYGEDGTLQGMLEMAGIHYVGSGVLGSSVAMDKVVQKQVCDQAGLPSVDYIWFLSKEWPKNKKEILSRVKKHLYYPIFTKPANLGSSVGIGKCHNEKELIEGIKEAIKYDSKVIIEQGVEDIHEIEVAVLGNDKPKASVPGEIIASNEFYDYNAKYVDGKSQAIIPAKIPQKVIKEIKETAVEAFKVLNLSGLARIDFLVKKRTYRVYLNEVNTLPGFTSISMYPQLWKASGLSYKELLDKLIGLALERGLEKEDLETSYKPEKDWYK